MNNVSLPPGMDKVKLPRRASDGVPYGEGRKLTPDVEDRFFMAECEVTRERGRPTKFVNGAELEHSCREYMLWVEQNPLYEKQQKFSGTTCKFYEANLPKKRPYTVGGMCLYLGITSTTWDSYRRDERFKTVTSNVDEAIRNQKFEGAASGFFNPAIIARDLGLVDKQEMTGVNGGPVEKIIITMTAQEASEAYAKTREGA